MASPQDVQTTPLQAGQNLPPKAGVSPANLATPLIYWYEADAQPVTVDGTVLSTVYDIGPNKFSLSPPATSSWTTTVLGPTWKANILNGLPAFRFPLRVVDGLGAATSTTFRFVSYNVNTTFWVGATAYITKGTGAGQSRSITAYDTGTGTYTVSPAWTTTPDTTTSRIVISFDGTSTLSYVTFGGVDGGGGLSAPYNPFSAPWTEVSVLVFRDLANSVNASWTGHAGGGGGIIYPQGSGSPTNVTIVHAGAVTSSGNGIIVGTPAIVYVEWRSAPTASRIRVTGVETDGAGPSAPYINTIGLGGDANGTGWPHVDICAHLAFAGALSAGDQAAVEHFFSAKYGFGGL